MATSVFASTITLRPTRVALTLCLTVPDSTCLSYHLARLSLTTTHHASGPTPSYCTWRHLAGRAVQPSGVRRLSIALSGRLGPPKNTHRLAVRFDCVDAVGSLTAWTVARYRLGGRRTTASVAGLRALLVIDKQIIPSSRIYHIGDRFPSLPSPGKSSGFRFTG